MVSFALKPQPTRRTSWQLAASLVVFYIPLVQQVANQHAVIDLSGCQLVGNPKTLRTSLKLVGNPGCQPRVGN